jgi:hypothetical protein
VGKVSLSTFFLCQLSPILLCLLFVTAFYSSSVFFLVPLSSSNLFNKSASLAFSFFAALYQMFSKLDRSLLLIAVWKNQNFLFLPKNPYFLTIHTRPKVYKTTRKIAIFNVNPLFLHYFS